MPPNPVILHDDEHKDPRQVHCRYCHHFQGWYEDGSIRCAKYIVMWNAMRCPRWEREPGSDDDLDTA